MRDMAGEYRDALLHHADDPQTLAAKVRTLCDSRSEIELVPYEKAYEAGFEDMPRRVPDLGKIQDLVGYQPRLQLDEILGAVIAHMRAALEPAHRP